MSYPLLTIVLLAGFLGGLFIAVHNESRKEAYRNDWLKERESHRETKEIATRAKAKYQRNIALMQEEVKALKDQIDPPKPKRTLLTYKKEP